MSLAALLFITSPRAVLLLPAKGLFFRQPQYRAVSRRMLSIGIARWLLTMLTLQIQPWSPIALVINVGLLWYTVFWGKKQLRGALFPQPASRPAPTPQPAGRPAPAQQAARMAHVPTMTPTASVSALQASTAASVPVPSPLPHLDAGSSILCPVCQTPTEPAAAECPDCGLLFSSRVPHVLHSLPDYEVLRPLGTGGMSSIYLAHKPYSDRLCVLKTLASVDSQSDPEWRAEAARCLRQEYELLRQLDHPNIARVLYWVSGDQCDFLVLEYVPGLTLEQRLSRGDGYGGTLPGSPLPLREALEHGRTIAGVLEYLARQPQPVVHHDIKPANLIVRPADQRLVLVDFGSALLMPDRQHQTVRLDCYGTPGYAAPEQYRASFSPKSDIYGLGATLYHLLTDDDPTAHPLKFPALDKLPPPVAHLLGAALADDPAARPDARQFHAALQHALQTLH
jgi:hypothetical protein